MNFHPVRLGIISALREEQAGLIEIMEDVVTTTRGMRDYVSGRLWGIECVCVLSRIGKVAAAATTATLIEKFGVSHIIFTGVAGAADSRLRVGDIVVARQLVQHDMNAEPLFPRYEVPLTGLSHFYSDQILSKQLFNAAQEFIRTDFHSAIADHDKQQFHLLQPLVYEGLIASGDEFIAHDEQLRKITDKLQDVLAVEMEGAAVAEVCFEFGIPFAIVRTISDGANEDSPVDFVQFLEKIAAHYAYCIVKRFIAINQGERALT
ncbi:5'-methylthioadenosine/adenosylhomocysteine nucleosidase [Herminiimonas sp. NPDC097707]|uniref:5'-methylthioadenosine/adenosylhomocysteine nucleosidase n=1 Tax=Herminiimonas sp. NPDC097707 TaxID=3364007 RepID=UPI00383A9ABA